MKTRIVHRFAAWAAITLVNLTIVQIVRADDVGSSKSDEQFCPPESLQEGEACGTDINGGCNSTPPVYGTLPCNVYICGTQWADNNAHDTDWYRFTITVPHTSVKWTVWSEFPAVALILTDNCGSTETLGDGSTAQLSVVAEVACPGLNPGTYIAFVAPAAFNGLPCESANTAYYGLLQCIIPCTGDTNTDSAVNVDDLMDLINHWGPCRQDGNPCLTCPQDVNSDGQVNVDDLLMLILNWGSCPTP